MIQQQRQKLRQTIAETDIHLFWPDQTSPFRYFIIIIRRRKVKLNVSRLAGWRVEAEEVGRLDRVALIHNASIIVT